MKRVTAVVRIACSLVSLTVCLLLVAGGIGLIPNDRDLILRGRSALCESVAINVSALAQRQDREAIAATLEALSRRNDDIVGLGVRLANGEMLFQTGDLGVQSAEETAGASTETHMFVPILSGDARWGTVEVSFRPIRPVGWWGALRHPLFLLAAFMSAGGLLLFYVYLRRVLQQLNPNRVVPQRVRAALDSLAEGLLLLDSKERIVHANSAFVETFQCKSDELLGKKASKLPWVGAAAAPDKGTPAGPTPPWLDVLRDGRSRRGQTLRLEGADPSQTRTFMVSAAPIHDDRGVSQGVITSFEDVTSLEQKKLQLVEMLRQLQSSSEQIREQNRQLEELATRDPLTGCFNRRYFFEKFDPAWEHAQQSAEPLSAVMVDVDHFKSVNDKHGHGTGDLVLKQVAAALRMTARDRDIVCRYGGEEFCVLLADASLDSAKEAAERLRLAIAALEFPELKVTASLGVSSLALGAVTPQEMLDQADKALYAAKRTGRNRVVSWDAVPADLELPAAKSARTEPSRAQAVSSIPFPAVTALISALSYRDSSTAEHSRRVADLCVALGETLLSMSDCYILEVAALLHDIGKIGVPDNILLKPAALTPEEWEVMRKHDRIGVEIIRASFACERLSAIIENHHAFFGGSPRDSQLPTGLDIPVGARILTICDAFDAMVSDRVYRKGRSAEEAFTELRRCAGSQFDPELVERFIQIAQVRNRRAARSPIVSKETALHIGIQLERLAAALDHRDINGLQTLSSRLQETAAKEGVREVALKAAELEMLTAQRADLVDILKSANGLLEACRSTQSSFFRESDELVEAEAECELVLVE